MAYQWKGQTKSFPENDKGNELNRFNEIDSTFQMAANQSYFSQLNDMTFKQVRTNSDFYRNSLFRAKPRQRPKKIKHLKIEDDFEERNEGSAETSFSNLNQRPITFEFANAHKNPVFIDDESEGNESENKEANVILEDKNIENYLNRRLPRKSVAFTDEINDVINRLNHLDRFINNDESDGQNDKPAWDTFEPFVIEDEDDTINSYWATLSLKIVKIICYIFTFALVLFFGILAKMTLHLMANMTKMNKAVKSCNRLQIDELNRLKLNHDKFYHSFLNWNSPERIAWIWMVYFVLITPDVFTFLKSLKVCLFKTTKRIDCFTYLTMFLTSTAQVIGVSILIYVVLPSFDSTSGLMFTHSIFLIPLFCLCLSKNNNLLFKIIYTVALILQIVALGLWPYLFYRKANKALDYQDGSGQNLYHDDGKIVWAIPLSAILISIGFYENYIDDGSILSSQSPKTTIKHLTKESKYRVYLLLSVWKCFLYLLSMLVIQALLASYQMNWGIQAAWDMIVHLFADFGNAFSQHQIPLVRENSVNNVIFKMESIVWAPIAIGLIQIVSSFLCYQAITFACRVCIQPFGFAMPVNLILPISVSLMNVFSDIYKNDPCNFVELNSFFEYGFWNVHYDLFELKNVDNLMIVGIWFITFILQMIATAHIWSSSKERLASNDRLFVFPFYITAVLDQSMMLSRRIDEETFTLNEEKWTLNREKNKDVNIKIYACATVWHETSSELVAMLKSIMRMDQDHCYRRLAITLSEGDPIANDYYEFETHLFVDDAFVVEKKTKNRLANQYVELLVKVMNEASGNVYQPCAMIKDPIVYTTPYGGRIEWTLPGGSKLIAHLKDKMEIRHRKRWSQVMYMYYLLGYKIYEQESDSNKRKELTNNTYILALDGDINFRPEAVMLLVDLMRNNPNLGAACGRVHPIGSGPMAWYQKFEYAISHWLQKATEHVFGCVLCSPGCFSLFRATALTETMSRYTTKPTEALHYVQYDQGEDRWLCTLMLQQGWRVEYCAASDAFTHCPEGFGEFYIQRRRWAPSTMANILDLLGSYKHTIEKNDNISSPYLLYQAGILLGTILSPGTIFLMLVGATNTAFDLSNDYSFYINFVPVLFFILICFFAQTEIQILVAQILSTFYAMLMLGVLVSTCIQIEQDTVWSPSVVFFVGMLVIFVFSALIHPQEFSCLFPSIIYLLTIPSMYLLLTIYSIINLNIVTWGTRETTQSEQPQEAPKVHEKPAETSWYDIARYFNNANKLNFSCLCCASEKKNDDDIHYFQEIQNSMSQLKSEMIEIKSNIEAQMKLTKVDIKDRRRASMFYMPESLSDRQTETQPLLNDILDLTIDEASPQVNDPTPQTQAANTESIGGQVWLEADLFKSLERKELTLHEIGFWVDFIKKYLKPLLADGSQKKVEADLIELRNKVVFAFGFINVLFVLFVFLLQMHKEMFSINIPVRHRFINRYYNDTSEEWIDEYDDKFVQMDPIGLIMIIFFGSLLLIQCIGMFIHRFSTFSHLIAFTNLNFSKINKEDIKKENAIKTLPALDIVRYLLSKECNMAAYEEPKSAIYQMEKNFVENFVYMDQKQRDRMIHKLKIRRESLHVAAMSLIRRNSLHPNGLLFRGMDETIKESDESNLSTDNEEANRKEVDLNDCEWTSFTDNSDDESQHLPSLEGEPSAGKFVEWTHL